MIRNLLNQVRPKFQHVSRYASRFEKTFRYGLDLVLWSRLLNRRRAAIPLDLPGRLLEAKGVTHAAPSLFIDEPAGAMRHWEDGFQAVYANLFLNLHLPDVLSEFRYAHPAPSFNGIYLWDSAFIAQIWKHWDTHVAHDIHQSVTQHQTDGRLQHVVTTFAESAYTQPPVLAWGVRELTPWLPTVQRRVFVQELYSKLQAYHDWLEQNRRIESGKLAGLYFWEHPYESGIDNSPRFSNRDESDFADTRLLASPDFSAYVALQNESLRDLAELLGHSQQATQYETSRKNLIDRINNSLWDEHDGLYYDRHIETGETIRSSTIAAFLPLWAGVPDQPQAERLKSHLLDRTQYNTRIPLPSVSRSHPQFSKDMWRGPVWVNTAFAVLQGLERYGFLDAVSELSFRLCDGVYKTYENTQKMHEFYDPDRHDLKQLHRKKGNRFKQITLGSKPVTDFVGWTGLANVLVIENLLGLKQTPDGVTLRPNLPSQATNLQFTVRLPEAGCTIQVERQPGGEHDCRIRNDDSQDAKTIAAATTWRPFQTGNSTPTSPTEQHRMRLQAHAGCKEESS